MALAAVFGLAIVIAGAGLLAWTRSRPAPAPSSATRFEEYLPADQALRGSVVVSPDGRTLAYSAMDNNGVTRLWVRPLDAAAAQPLPGTEGAQSPFWSPGSD